MSEIKIGVACHKPAELPQNDLFVPIQVGAALATKDLGIQRDDEGENISAKNPGYCELTAQYWLWKNAKADYYGLCHYRRFLCFRDGDFQRNRRRHIEASIINDYNLERFGLNDDEEMRKIIEQNDIVTGELQDMRRLPTPRGVQSTARKHWLAHARYLISPSDLDLMLKILSEVSPELGKATKTYLDGHYFLGFNCFVMKKELFDEMCRIEFEVLRRLEKQVDLTNYSQQMARIYGFMGEIINSAYIYHVEQDPTRRVKHVPLVYFNYTDPQTKIMPTVKKKVATVPVLFYAADTDPVLFGTTWQSFLDSIQTERNVFYDAHVMLTKPSAQLQKSLQAMLASAACKTKVSLRVHDAQPLREYYSERLRLQGGHIGPESDRLSILPFLPHFFSEYQKMLIVGENALVTAPLSEFWQSYQNAASMVAAPYNVLKQAQANDVYARTAEEYLASFLKNPLDYFSTSAFILNFAQFRDQSSEDDIAQSYRIPNVPKVLRATGDIFNLLCEGQVTVADQKWCIILEREGYLKVQLSYAPHSRLQALRTAQKTPGLITYLGDDPFLPIYDELAQCFWQVAQRTPFYEYLLQYATTLAIREHERAKRHSIYKAIMNHNGVRSKLWACFPQNSKRYRAAKKLVRKLGGE